MDDERAWGPPLKAARLEGKASSAADSGRHTELLEVVAVQVTCMRTRTQLVQASSVRKTTRRRLPRSIYPSGHCGHEQQ